MSMVDKLAYLKKQCGWTTEEISAKINVPKGTLDKVFSGLTKSPGLETIYRLCRLFDVPIRYFLDDSVPMECRVTAYAESCGLHMMSDHEFSLFVKFRNLDEHDKRSMEMALELLDRDTAPHPGNGAEKRLLCFEPCALSQMGSFADSLGTRVLYAPMGSLVEQADFAVHILNLDLEPIYHVGAVLAVKTTEVCNEQLGAFLVNREGFIRKLSVRRGVRKLVALNKAKKDIILKDTDTVVTMGAVLGAIRTYRWQL